MLKTTLAFTVSMLLVAGAADAVCATQKISCGQTIHGALTDDDCSFSAASGFRWDRYFFDAARGGSFSPHYEADFFSNAEFFGTSHDPDGDGPQSPVSSFIDVASSSFDFNPNRQVFNAGRQYLNVNSNSRGNYSLTLVCDPLPPTPAGSTAAIASTPPVPEIAEAVTDPELPGFRFWATINGVNATKEPCLQETLCFSGAIPGRSEAFIRIVGPKPNGRLWPNVVKFTTSKFEVWIQQISTGDMQYYLSPAGSTENWDLLGQYDKNGFAP